MSGPKAFRIVTRAEIMTICRRSLARLDAAIEDWISRGHGNGTIDKADMDKVIARRDALRALLSADKFVELQKQLPAEISYLQADAERRAEKAAELEAQSKRTMRRMKAAAQALLASLESSSIDSPSTFGANLRPRRRRPTASTRPSARACCFFNRRPLRRASLIFSATSPTGLAQASVASRLEEWMSQQSGTTDDQALLRVDGFLGELKGLGIDPGPFSARISALEAEPPARPSSRGR